MSDLNLNHAINENFRLLFTKNKDINFFIKGLPIPTIANSAISTPNNAYQAMVAGNHVTYGSLTTTVFIDEDWNNFKIIFNVLRDHQRKEPVMSMFEEADLILFNRNNTVGQTFKFSYLIPTSISGISLTSDTVDAEDLTMDITWEYSSFDIED